MKIIGSVSSYTRSFLMRIPSFTFAEKISVVAIFAFSLLAIFFAYYLITDIKRANKRSYENWKTHHENHKTILSRMKNRGSKEKPPTQDQLDQLFKGAKKQTQDPLSTDSILEQLKAINDKYTGNVSEPPTPQDQQKLFSGSNFKKI